MLLGKLQEPSRDAVHAYPPKVMPRDYAPWAATLQSVQRVGADIFVRVRAIDKEEIDASVVGRIVEPGAVAEQRLNLSRDAQAFPDVSLHLKVLFDMEAVNRRSRESECAIGRQIKRVNGTVIVAIEGHV